LDALIWTLIARSALALLLAVAGAASARWSARPGMTYSVCALAIAVLLAPPLIELKVLPDLTAADTVVSTAADPILPLEQTTLPFTETPSRSRIGLTQWLVAIWGTGSLTLVLIAWWRLRRFSTALADRQRAPEAIQTAAARLGKAIGLRQVPPVFLTTTAITPLLRPRARSLEIIFPAPLLNRLTPEERDTLLAHELSHVQRGDHWMRIFEFAGATLFWWHPAVWWARRELRRAEEQLCDRRVLEHLPQLRAAYARALFKTAEFLADSGPRLPALACGAGEARFLKERLLMIVEQGKSRLLSRTQRVALTLLAVALLVFLPTWADRAPRDDAENHGDAIDPSQRIVELEHRAQLLERELEELRAQQMMIEGELRMQRELGDGSRAAEEEIVRAEFLLREAEFRRDAERAEAQVRELELDNRQRQVEHESTLMRLAREAEQAAAEGDQAHARALQTELAERQLEAKRELTTRTLEVDRQRLESEMHRNEMSSALEAEKAARMLELRARELEMHRAQKVERQAEMELERELADQLEALTNEERERDSQSEAELLREQIEFLKQQLEAVQKNDR